MSTATYRVTTVEGEAVMVTAHSTQLRPELEQAVEDILGLRSLATTTGFMTFKSVREILAQLTPKDQAAVGRELAKREKQSPTPQPQFSTKAPKQSPSTNTVGVAHFDANGKPENYNK
jgi:hypothetical protein